jgi:lysine-specific demethylase 8
MLLLLIICLPCIRATHPPGHLEKLGSHQPSSGHVETLDATVALPDPIDFYSLYVKPQRPVVIRQAVAATPALQKWTDELLEEEYGDLEIGAETLKKEDRNNPGEAMLFQEFLQRYKTEDIYLVNDLPEPMHKDWMIPRFLLCGGYMENIQEAYTWLSSGGTSSVLHVDQAENLHCVVDGYKTFIIIDPQYLDQIGLDDKQRGHYNIDVDRVDLEKYPGLVGVPWYEAVVYKGDCLYLPYLWLHQVRSYVHNGQRNMGVNLWWHPFVFNESDCVNQSDIPQYMSLSNFTPRPAFVVRSMLKEVAREDGFVYYKDFQEKVKERISSSDEVLLQLFRYIDPKDEGQVPIDDIEKLDYSVFQQMMEYLIQQQRYKEEEDFETTDSMAEETAKDEL